MKKIVPKIAYKSLMFIIIICLVFFLILYLFRFVEKNYVYPLVYKEEVETFCKEFNLSNTLIYSIIKVESNFNKSAKSQKGAVGLMQLTPDTAQYIANLLGEKDYDLYSEKVNIRFGCFYVKYLLDRFKNTSTAIVAYNAGEGNVKSWLKNKEYSLDGKTLIDIPFSESKNYLKKIKETFIKYQNLYGNIVDKQKIFS